MAEYRRRLDALRKRMADRELDAVVITTPENIFYVTGYQTVGYYYFQALVVPLEADAFMVTRRLEQSNVVARTWLEKSRAYEDTDSPIAVLADTMTEAKLGKTRVGFEKGSWFFRATEQEALFAQLDEATFVDCTGIVEDLRLVKSDVEIEVMRRAVVATEAGMKAGIEAVAAGVTENDVAAEIHYAMIKAGSEHPAISPFVASGWRCGVGHATWEHRTIEANDVVFLEVGGCVHRYHAALMRTVKLGDLDKGSAEAEELIEEAVDAALNVMRPGVAAGEVDRTCREILGRHPLEDGGGQPTRTGYSIGIGFAPDWGEGHILSLIAGEERQLEPNMTFHLIPWIVAPGVAGVGISETVRVTETGAERMTSVGRKIFRA